MSTLREKAEAAGLNYHTVRNRIARGWSEKKALSTPTNKVGRHKEKPVIVEDPDLGVRELKPTFDDYTDGFIIMVAVVILGLVAFGLGWMAL